VRQVKRNKGKEVAVKVIAGVRVVPLPESRKVVPHDGAFRGDTHVTRRVHGLDAARPILDAMAQPVIVTDLETTILYWNPAATDLYGFTASEALGQPVHSLLGTPSDLPVVKGADAQTGRGRSWTGELEARTRSGKPLTVLVTLTPLGTQDGAPVALIATAVDVTVAVEDRHRLTEALVLVEEKSGELRHQALHDFLTGLPNRALVLDRAEQMLSRARRQDVPVAALFLDVDSFKDINDSLGHAAGDQLLKEVAARLSGALRDADTIGRLGGDEFVVLVEGTSLDAGAAVVAERLLEVLGEPFILHGSEGSPTPYAVTASIGIAEGDRPQVEDLFRDADMALYRAKAAGRNCYMFFAPEMHAAVRDRLVLEADLRAALDCGQFFLEYQPAFGLADLTTVGIEALLRWRHPARGVVAPLEFISRLEETGLILPAGRWILGEACRQCAEWHHDGLPLAVSVNISGRQLESGSFLTDVIDALSTSGLAPGALVLEFTENVLMGDAEATIGRLEALKAIGVRIAIDNFGTGYPSLAYLRRFPVDILKIDRSFISAMSDSGEGEALLHTLVQLGKQLGLETVAEGIETEDQLYRLQLQDCDTGQGFLVAKPMSASAIKEFVRSSLPQKAAVPALLL
jgi:diguanylate cyclase (GGDEF)-like protein/PAS domain S-box-containing protein